MSGASSVPSVSQGILTPALQLQIQNPGTQVRCRQVVSQEPGITGVWEMHGRNFVEERPPRREGKAGFAVSPLSRSSKVVQSELLLLPACPGLSSAQALTGEGLCVPQESNALNPSQPPAGPSAPELCCSPISPAC